MQFNDLLKIPSIAVDDPNAGGDEMRMYRDKSTDQFVATIFDNRQKMYKFLDYTFHTINTFIAIKVNEELANLAKRQPNANILPLHGDESIIFAFKGGSVMHIIYDNFLGTPINKSSIKDLTSEDLTKMYSFKKDISNYISANRQKMAFNYDIEKALILPEKTDTIETFADSILKPKFKISDIDYSLYLNVADPIRYLQIHTIVIKLVYTILSHITKKFDQHLATILELNGAPYHPAKPKQYVASTEPPLVYNTPSYRLYLDLKRHVHTGFSNGKLSDYNDLRNRIAAVVNDYKPTKSLWVATAEYNIVEYVEYINKVNPRFFAEYQGLGDLSATKQKILDNITIIIESKEYDLLSMPYYTIEDIQKIRENLANFFSTLSPEAPELQPTFAKVPGTDKVNTFQLVDNTTIKPDNFRFKKTNCYSITINPATLESELHANKCDQYHFISYNAAIDVIKGPNRINFDLMRSKVNLVMTGSHFIRNGRKIVEQPVPSEFIDISIPRFDDTGLHHYLDNLPHSDRRPINAITNGLPYALPLHASNRTIVINSYGPEDLSHDLVRTVFNMNQFEPWLDEKFQKRIIRSIYFIVLNRTIDTVNTSSTSQDDFLTFLDFCIQAKANNPAYLDSFTKMAFQKGNVTASSSTDVVKYYQRNLETKTIDSVSKFSDGTVINLIDAKYHDVANFINCIMFWTPILFKPKNEIKDYVNLEREIFGWEQITSTGKDLDTEIDALLTKYHNLLDTIINIGIKMHYTYSQLSKTGFNTRMKGGAMNEVYKRKYLKYKDIYLTKKNNQLDL